MTILLGGGAEIRGWQANGLVEVVGNALDSNTNSSQSIHGDTAADRDSSSSQKEDGVDKGLDDILQSLEFGSVECDHRSLQRGSSDDGGIEAGNDVLQNDEILLELINLGLDEALSRSSHTTSGTGRNGDDGLGRAVESGDDGTQICINDAFSLDNDRALGADIVLDSRNGILWTELQTPLR